jgi:hypothetical protein
VTAQSANSSTILNKVHSTRPCEHPTSNIDEAVKSPILTTKCTKNTKGQKIFNNFSFVLFVSFVVSYKHSFLATFYELINIQHRTSNDGSAALSPFINRQNTLFDVGRSMFDVGRSELLHAIALGFMHRMVNAVQAESLQIHQHPCPGNGNMIWYRFAGGTVPGQTHAGPNPTPVQSDPMMNAPGRQRLHTGRKPQPIEQGISNAAPPLPFEAGRR